MNAAVDLVRPNWPQAILVALGVFMATTDVSSVGVALPTIAHDLDVDLPAAQWVALGYMLGTASLILVFGRLSDLIGRRRLALTGFAIYGTFAIVSTLSFNLEMLIAARVVQSVGGSMLQSTGAALMVTAFPSTMRGRAMGLNGSVVSLGLLLGPIIGGVITGLADWRFIFVPAGVLGILAVPLGFRILKEEFHRRERLRLDWLSVVSLVGWIGLLVFGLNQSVTRGWDDIAIIGSLAIAGLLLAIFLWRQLYGPAPLVNLGIFRVRMFTLSIGIGFLTFSGLSGHILMTPFLFQDAMGIDPFTTGVLLSLMPLGAVLLAFRAGAFADRHGPRIPASIGLMMMATGVASMFMLGPESEIWEAGARMLFIGLGQGLFMSPNSSSIMGSLPRSQIGLAGAFNAWMRTFGFALGAAIFGLIFTTVVLSDPSATDALEAPFAIARNGYWAVYGGSAILFLIGAILAATRGRVVTPETLD